MYRLTKCQHRKTICLIWFGCGLCQALFLEHAGASSVVTVFMWLSKAELSSRSRFGLIQASRRDSAKASSLFLFRLKNKRAHLNDIYIFVSGFTHSLCWYKPVTDFPLRKTLEMLVRLTASVTIHCICFNTLTVNGG